MLKTEGKIATATNHFECVEGDSASAKTFLDRFGVGASHAKHSPKVEGLPGTIVNCILATMEIKTQFAAIYG